LEECSDWALKKMSEYDYFHILDLNYYEVANALKHKVFGKFTVKDSAEAFSKAFELMNLFDIHGFSETVNDALSLALELNVTVYDAAFMSLACKLDMRFLTLDVKLAKNLEGTKLHDILEYPKS
jgi:predicted nucleic acid-binding protein